MEINSWVDNVSTEYFTASMNTGQLYKIVPEFFDNGYLAQAYLYWSYTGQSQTIIPSSNMKYLQYLNNIPLTLQVYPSCGNGVLTINEE